MRGPPGSYVPPGRPVPTPSQHLAHTAVITPLIVGCTSPPHPVPPTLGPVRGLAQCRCSIHLCTMKDSQDGARSEVERAGSLAQSPFSAWAHSPHTYTSDP